MGRKTTKGAKDRKQRRREEQAKLSAAKIKIDAANKLEDPMATLLPFKKFDRNGVSLTIDCKKLPELDEATQEFVFQLCKDNMQALYESSNWGWKDREKKEEMIDDRAWYLIALDAANKPVAFVHFRFDIEIDEEVLYCYEIQLTKEVRRKGLGKFLMQILELIAFKAEMLKVMLTTFKHNDPALKFFTEALKVSLTIDCKRLPELDEATQEFVFQLCKDNMQALYESSNWGWKDREKKEEMIDDRAWYLIALDAANKPVAFVHFRFDIEIDEEVLYCYEIQLTKEVRRKGLGKFLMQILELIAFKAEMLKVMLTTFKHNDPALKFFTEALKYQMDESSPEDGMFEDDCQYWILSKNIKPKIPKAGTAPSTSQCCGGHPVTNGHTHGVAS